MYTCNLKKKKKTPKHGMGWVQGSYDACGQVILVNKDLSFLRNRIQNFRIIGSDLLK